MVNICPTQQREGDIRPTGQIQLHIGQGEVAREHGDASYLSEKLAKTMLDSGIYLNENSRLVDFSDEEYEATTATKGNKAKKTPKKWAIINMDSRDELVVLDENGTTLLFNNEEDARQAARGRFEDYHEDALDELVIRWNATHPQEEPRKRLLAGQPGRGAYPGRQQGEDEGPHKIDSGHHRP